jgi:hypothetical protein
LRRRRDRVGRVAVAHGTRVDPAEADGRFLAGAVDGGRGGDREARGVGRDREHAERVVGSARDDEQEVGAHRVGDVHLRALEHPAVTLRRGGGLRLAPTGPPAGFPDRHGADDLARGEPGQQGLVVARGAGERDEADRADRAREERARVHPGPHRLEDDGEVDHPHARATVRLRGEEADDTQVREPGPDLGRGADVSREEVADVGQDRGLLREEPAHRLGKQLLVGRPLEIHLLEDPSRSIAGPVDAWWPRAVLAAAGPARQRPFA